MSRPLSKHPEDLDLLRLLDGELPSAQAKTIQRHLETCWHCRTERNELQASIDAFVRYRERILLPHLPPPPRRWPELSELLADWDATNQPAPVRAWHV